MTTDDDDLSETDSLALEEWNRPRDTEPEKEAEETGTDVIVETEVINEATGEERSLGQAVERINILEEELSAKEEVMKAMETELTKAKDLANIATAT